MNLMIQTGIVFLVGAGPGDPDLITVKGMKCLQQADVVVYDRLANPVLLDYAPPFAEFVYVGKEPQRHRLSQDEINAVLVQYAQQGKRVVRLKGGDPFVFGRGGEEAAVRWRCLRMRAFR
jgi:siroheme synthase